MTTKTQRRSDERTKLFRVGAAGEAAGTALAIRTNNQSIRRNSDGAMLTAGDVGSHSNVTTRLIARDSRAMEELFDQMAGRAFGLAYRILDDGPAAEDVVQDVFTWIWDHPEKLDPTRGTIEGLLLTLTHRRSIDALRSMKRRSQLPNSSTPGPIAFEAAEMVDEVQRNLDALAVRSAIEDLPSEQYSVVELAYFGGMTHREISLQTDLPLGTVKSRLRLALGTLRKAFGLPGTKSSMSDIQSKSGGAS